MKSRWPTWRRFLRRRPKVPIFFSEKYAFSLPNSPLDPLRGHKVLASLTAQGSNRLAVFKSPPQSSFQELLLVHSRDYLGQLESPESTIEIVGTALDDHQRLKAIRAQRAMVGGTLLATRAALKNQPVAVNLGGGLHHARSTRGGGFCLFHDVAIAIATLRQEGFDGKILVVDLDLHDGDGTRLIFKDDPTVFTFSIHNRNWAPSDALASLAIELGSGVTDPSYLETLKQSLPKVVASFAPDLVFFLAGTDVAASDPLGDWQISADGLLERDRWVLTQMQSLPTVLTLAGGYGSSTWQYTASTLSLILTGSPREPLTTDEATLRHYRSLARHLGPSELEREPLSDDPDDWGLSNEDLFGAVGGRGSTTRFLGYYTTHGIELALEVNGVLERLRDLGYSHPMVELDLGNPPGQTLRVWGEQHRIHLLIELKARRDRTLVQGVEVLYVEWLLLQNPKGHFSSHRPKLRGQTHPGLGLLSDAMALLVVVCDRLNLDGIAFTPSHFHIAAQSHRQLRFLDPTAEALLRNLEACFPALSLPQIAKALGSGSVVDLENRVQEFRPSLMVLPIRRKLKALFGAEFEGQVEAARTSLKQAQ